MKMIWILALKELRDGLRNRWVAATIILLGVLALSLSLLGSAPTGSVRVSALNITVVNLASLSVYLVPLIALLLSFDALVGEFERGTMLLLLTYPVTRWQVILGKFLGHLVILFLAIFVGYGASLFLMILMTDSGADGWEAYFIMMCSSLLLGAVFIALGYMVSALVKERATAIGSVIGLWLIFVVLYDLLLFGVLLIDKGQLIGQKLFSILMLISPTDSYRILNLSISDDVGQSAGVAGIASQAGLSTTLLISVILLWVIIPLMTTLVVFQRREL